MNAALRFGPFLTLCLAGTIFFCSIDVPLLEPEEARYAEIPRQMLAQGRFIEPVLHDEPYYHKPPLFYWLVMASYTLFGIHDWAARIVPAGAALLTVLVCYLWTRRITGPLAAFLACCILMLSPRFVYMGRMILLDGVLCLCITSAFAAAHLAIREESLRWRWWILSALACGLGIMVKGPVSLVLVIVPMVLCSWGRLSSLPRQTGIWLLYAFIAIGLAAPWYIIVAMHAPEAFADFLWLHNIQRFAEPFDHVKPFWYYAPIFLLGSLPWSLLLPGMLRRITPRTDAEGADLIFPVFACVWCLVFFSLSGCKRPAYILPAFPPLAVALGIHVAQRQPWQRWLRSESGNPSLALLPRWLFLTVSFVGLGLVAAALLSSLCIHLAGFVAIALLLAVMALVLRMTWRRPTAAWAASLAAAFIVTWSALVWLLPEYHRRFSLRDQLAPLRTLAADHRLAVACYPKRWDSVSFYLGRNDVLVARADACCENDCTLVVVKASLFGDWLAKTGAAAHFTMLARSKRVCIAMLHNQISKSAAPYGSGGCVVGWASTNVNIAGPASTASVR